VHVGRGDIHRLIERIAIEVPHLIGGENSTTNAGLLAILAADDDDLAHVEDVVAIGRRLRRLRAWDPAMKGDEVFVSAIIRSELYAAIHKHDSSRLCVTVDALRAMLCRRFLRSG